MKPRCRVLSILALLLPAAPSPAEHDTVLGQGETYRVPVTAVRAELGAIRLVTRVQGQIEAIDTPQIHSEVAAEITEVLVDEGDAVAAGQVLARLDDEGFRLDREAAAADIVRLEALLENQQSTLERDRSLTRQKLISDAKLEDSQAAVKQARAQLAHARSLLKKAEYALSHTRVVAPIAGRVQQRSVSPGDYVNPNSPSSKPLFQIVDTLHLRARLYFPENLAHRVTVGTELELLKGTLRLPTRIGHLRPMLEPGTRALHALADFDNAAGWVPGESVSADVVLERREGAVLVPEAVLVRRPTGLVVYLLQDGQARQAAVVTGIREGGRVEILDGVAAGDLLALDGAGYLRDGVAVTLRGDGP